MFVLPDLVIYSRLGHAAKEECFCSRSSFYDLASFMKEIGAGEGHLGLAETDIGKAHVDI